MTKQEFLGYLHEENFAQMFIECFWDRPTTTAPYAIGETSFAEVAQKKGYRIYVAKVEKLPDSAVRRLFDAKLRKRSQDYLAIYVSTSEPFHHLWSIPVKTVDKRQLVTIEYVQDDQAAFLLEKMNALTFGIDDAPTIVDVVEKANGAFLVNTADVTKKFYAGFRKQHDAFVKGIENVGAKEDREWYASVMLNRLMFCYFIQKKRFLDFNENYLGDKLREVQAKKGKDKFYESFYRSFLKQLFSDGLDKPVSGRSDYFLKKYGRIPYLNGGMFSEHQIEAKNANIDIPDKLFEDLFAFFDQWHWHLDNRITASGRDINPDVLGYIFEQYINDRAQMGAYYTKEDITEYIGRNCIVPYLFEAVKKVDARPFAKEGEVWLLLKGSGDAYVFPAVKKGVDLPLPENVERGVDPSKPNLRARRADWNRPADDAYALPTEIWRETVARRQRCMDVRAKIAGGEITDIHDFITYNLDIRAFAEDVIRKTGDRKLVLHFYKAIREVTILDPTCGSGAFLFAALNILEPLYEACLDRMEEYHAANGNLFKDELEEIAGKFRSNRQYFIYKNVILRNLYGVDIMHEATEIARLRLFLKMVAVVDVDPYDDNLGLDPLPDIEFNIRCGNTLVGYASEKEIENDCADDLFKYAELKNTIESEMEKVSMAYDFFMREQLKLLGSRQQLVDAKQDVDRRLKGMRVRLDDLLFKGVYGKKKAQWLADTQPFHWYTEFYPIMHGRGGFDVIIGNPPYVSKSKIDYLGNIKDFSCSDLYGYVIRRVYQLLQVKGHHGFIVMHNLAFSSDFADTRKVIFDHSTLRHFSFYSRIPSGLFSGDCRVRNTIYITSNGSTAGSYTSRLHRWYQEQREMLFQDTVYCTFDVKDEIPMSDSSRILEMTCPNFGIHFSEILRLGNKHPIYFKKITYNFISVSGEEPDAHLPNKKRIKNTGCDVTFADTLVNRDMLLCLFSGRLYFAKWCIWGDDFHYTKGELLDFRFPFDSLSAADTQELLSLAKELKKRAKDTIQYKLNAGKYVGTYNTSKLWDITDQSDAIFLKYICDDPVQVQEDLFLFVSQMAVTMKKGSDELNAE